MDSGNEEQSSNGRVTLRAIARRVGCSHVTVSHALTGKGRVCNATRSRIRRVAREMGYVTDPVMSRMMRHIRDSKSERRSETIGLLRCKPPRANVLDDAEMIEGIEQQASLMGYSLDHFTIGPRGLSPMRLLKILETRGIRGLLLAGGSVPELEGEQFRNFVRVKLPLPSKNPNIIYVGRNPYLAYEIVYTRLRDFGYSRVGFAMRACIEGFERSMIAGCLETIAPRPSPAEEPGFQPLFIYDEHSDKTTEKMRDWVEENRLEAIVGGNAAFPFVCRMGYRIPQELGFVSTNLKAELPYSGVSLCLRRVGIVGVRALENVLMASLYGQPETTEVIFVPPDWVEGATLVPRKEMFR